MNRRSVNEAHRLAAILESMDDAVLELGLDGMVRFCNQGAVRLFGRDLTGSHMTSCCPPALLDEHHELLRTAELGGSVRNHETVRLVAAGREAQVAITVSPVRDEAGAPVAAVVILRDLTEAKQLQARISLADRLGQVGQLAAGLSHELNNPLAVVIANLGFAVEALDQAGRRADQEGGAVHLGDLEALREPLGEARQAAERVRTMARDLKVFSRPDEPRREPVDVRRVIESALRIAGNEIRHRARLVKDLAEVPLVLANDGLLGQVFLNLVVNAAQSIPEGRAEHNEIRVSTRSVHGRVLVEVQDSGSGIAPENEGKIFDAFFTTKPVGVGTGLGLSLCQRIVSDLGGSLTIGQTSPGGTTMVVDLPALAVETRAPSAGGGREVAIRRGKVLVVDDEPMVAKAVQRVLATEHEVVAVASAERALERLRAGEAYDVIFCDLMMPQMTGMDLYEALAAELPDSARRVIFLTGGAFTVRARQFLEATPNLRVDKPFDAAYLRALVNSRVR